MTIDRPLPSQLPHLRSLWQEAFGDTDDFLTLFFRTAFREDRCRCVTEDGRVTAALYWLDCKHMDRPIAYLYAVATAKERRGRGLCHRLMEDTHRHLTALGYEGAILVPGNEALFRFYETMGYRTCGHIRRLRCRAGEHSIPLRSIGLEEYRRLRASLLPPGGVIQETECLSLLQGMASFYAGDGFLLAASIRENTVHGAELLGDVSAAPYIVRALGCTEGSFRTVGSETPFAMYHSLGSAPLPPPTYLGLALD